MFSISIAVALVFFILQLNYFLNTWKARETFADFFARDSDYSVFLCGNGGNAYPQISLVGAVDSDLYNLIKEINDYLFKTKGTSDYEFIHGKVERKLNMRYDQATVHLTFPTYLGLMGTFLGVFMGIAAFLCGFDANEISDESIKNLLLGVLVSMATSLSGLFLTTVNTSKAGDARKKIEEDKNYFYDFIQTEVTKTASASLVSAISKLHDTVDKFEPAFSTVIDGFKSAFRECTKAFSGDFRKNVQAVHSAVALMGENMDKINENIELEKKLLATIGSREFVDGMDKYVEAASHFSSITRSLKYFEEARTMMLTAAQEVVALQNQLGESLKMPREVAVRVGQILDRVKDFEKNVNELGPALRRREILGNDIVNALQDQIRGISKKGKIADKFLEMSDKKLEDLYQEQVKALVEMNRRYKDAIEGHIEGFETMLQEQTEELWKRHHAFMQAIEERLSIEDVRQEFTSLRRLEQIERKLEQIASSSVTTDGIHREVLELQKELKSFREEIKPELESIRKNTKTSGGITLFGRR